MSAMDEGRDSERREGRELGEEEEEEGRREEKVKRDASSQRYTSNGAMTSATIPIPVNHYHSGFATRQIYHSIVDSQHITTIVDSQHK